MTYGLFALTLLNLLMLCFSGIANRFELIHFRTALDIYSFCVRASMPLLVGALICFVLSLTKKREKKLAVYNLVVVLITGIIIFSGAQFKKTAQSLPLIHDITTDTANPPQFRAILNDRKDAPNPTEYGGPEIAELQKQAYSDIQPLDLALAKVDAFDRVLKVVDQLGWKLVAQSLPEGRIEATDTTLFFGFKDDVVIRVSELTPQNSRIDIRSLSRVGKSDVGANAKRIRKFMKQLQLLSSTNRAN